MKEELQTKLVEILTSVQTAVGRASDFAVAELPDIAQSYVVYGRVMALVVLCFGLGLLVVAVLLGRMGYRESRKPYAERQEGLEILGLVGSALPGVIGTFVLMFNTSNAVLVWFAPKVWLLKEIAGMLK
jgi:hypothetical protein